MLLKQAINEFRKYTEVSKSKGTQDYYKFYLKTLDQELGSYDCSEITNNIILDYIIKRRNYNSKVSNATINKHIVTLKTVIKYATSKEITFSKLKEKKW